MPLRQNTQATAAALGKSLRDTTLTLQFTNELSAYLALADSPCRARTFFPSTASQQFLELRDELQRLDRHFQALLIRVQIDLHVNDADPNNLKRYALANSKVTCADSVAAPLCFPWRFGHRFLAAERILHGQGFREPRHRGSDDDADPGALSRGRGGAAADGRHRARGFERYCTGHDAIGWLLPTTW